MKDLKEKRIGEKGHGKSFVVPKEYIDAIKCSLKTEMHKDFEAQREKMALDMKQELEAEKDKMVD